MTVNVAPCAVCRAEVPKWTAWQIPGVADRANGYLCETCYPSWLDSDAGRSRRAWLAAIGTSDDRRRRQLTKLVHDGGCAALAYHDTIAYRDGDNETWRSRTIAGTAVAWAAFLHDATNYDVRRALTAALTRDDPLLAVAAELWPEAGIERSDEDKSSPKEVGTEEDSRP